MKEKITFREYVLPTKDPQTGVEERGEYLGSFKKTFVGASVSEINDQIVAFLKKHAEENQVDVRVWQGQ